MSHMPLWLAPSSPVMPARSSTKVTAGLVQREVHQHLVEGAVEEGRVDRDDRVQAAERQAGRARSTACCSAMPTSKIRSG